MVLGIWFLDCEVFHEKGVTAKVAKSLRQVRRGLSGFDGILFLIHSFIIRSIRASVAKKEGCHRS